MITLRKLKWSNCFSYGENNELNLEENTVTQLVGTNGMGKSSIPLIIEEALFNKNSKGIKKADIPNRYNNAGYHIHLEFTKDSKHYDVIIDRKSSIKLRLLEDGEDVIVKLCVWLKMQLLDQYKNGSQSIKLIIEKKNGKLIFDMP